MRPHPRPALLVICFMLLMLACSSCHRPPCAESAGPDWLEAPGTRFVAPGGDDAGPGTEGRPWRTLESAVDRLAPGDVLVVEEGTYPESILLHAAGTADRPVIVKARVPGSAVIDAGGRPAFADRGMGVSHVVVAGLRIENASRGFDFDGPAEHLTIAQCEIVACRQAFLCDRGARLRLIDVSAIDCDDGIGIGVKGRCGVDGVEIVRCRSVRRSAEEGGDNTDGFRVEGLCSDVLVSQCEAAGYDDAGFDIKPDGAVVERCLAHHNWDNGFKLWGRDARLINCIARDNDDTGVTISDAVGLYNCTIAFNRRAAIRPQADDISAIVVRNCIIAWNFVRQYIEEGGPGVYDDDYNLYFAEDDELIWKVMDGDKARHTLEDLRDGALPLGEHSIFANPRFASIEDRDLRLRSDSPAIGAGVPLDFVTLDFAGTARPAPPDIGALQH